MICPHCNQEHPDEFLFCPITGQKIELLKTCINPNCSNFGKHILPLEGVFCPSCGYKLTKDDQQKAGSKTQKEKKSTTKNNRIEPRVRNWDIYIKRETDPKYDYRQICCYIINDKYLNIRQPKLFYCHLEKSGDITPFIHLGGITLLVELSCKNGVTKKQIKIPKGFKGDISISIDDLENIHVELQS